MRRASKLDKENHRRSFKMTTTKTTTRTTVEINGTVLILGERYHCKLDDGAVACGELCGDPASDNEVLYLMDDRGVPKFLINGSTGDAYVGVIDFNSVGDRDTWQGATHKGRPFLFFDAHINSIDTAVFNVTDLRSVSVPIELI